MKSANEELDRQYCLQKCEPKYYSAKIINPNDKLPEYICRLCPTHCYECEKPQSLINCLRCRENQILVRKILTEDNKDRYNNESNSTLANNDRNENEESVI